LFKRESGLLGIASILFALLTFIGMIVADPPGGDYKESDITSFLAHDHRTACVVGVYLMLAGAVALLYLLATLRGRLSGRAGAFFAATGTAAGAAWAIGAVLVTVVPLGLANGGVVAPEPHTVYMLTQVGFATLFAAGGILLGVTLIALAATSLFPGWLRVVTLVAGILGLVSPAFFPFMALLLWGLVFGIWSLASKRLDATPAAVPA
jgi:hypothetical protein